MSATSDSLNMSSPAVYRIRSRGKLNPQDLRCLEGLNVTEESASGDPPVTVLVGRFVDQAELSGLLNALYETHLPLISVDCLDVEPVKTI